MKLARCRSRIAPEGPDFSIAVIHLDDESSHAPEHKQAAASEPLKPDLYC